MYDYLQRVHLRVAEFLLTCVCVFFNPFHTKKYYLKFRKALEILILLIIKMIFQTKNIHINFRKVFLKSKLKSKNIPFFL